MGEDTKMIEVEGKSERKEETNEDKKWKILMKIWLNIIKDRDRRIDDYTERSINNLMEKVSIIVELIPKLGSHI